MLAGLVKSPSRLAPNRNPEGAEKRAQIVLAAMRDAGYITERRRRPPRASRLRRQTDRRRHHQLCRRLDRGSARRSGRPVDQNIVVDTTIDPKLQSIAEAAVIDELAAKSVKFNVDPGRAGGDDADGAVRAMVGGRDYARQPVQPRRHRQAPAGLGVQAVRLSHRHRGRPDAGHDPAGRPDQLKGWKPENYSHEYFGRVTLTQALAMSLNTVAARLALEVGADERGAHRASARHQLEARSQRLDRARHLGSLAAGTGRRLCAVRQWRLRALSPMSSTASAPPGARCSTQRPPRSARSSDRAAQRRDDEHHDAANADSGTARKAAIPGLAAAGKTGTSQDFRDAWFIGYTAKLVTGVWLGNDDNSPTKKATGGGLPVEVWTRFMRAAHQGVPVAGLPMARRAACSPTPRHRSRNPTVLSRT